MSTRGDLFSRPHLRELVGVGLAGGAGLVVDYALLWVLAVRLDVVGWLAAGTAFALSAVVNFSLNRRVFVARGGELARQGRRYVALFGVNLVVTSLTVPRVAGLLDGLGDDASVLVAKSCVVAVLLLFNTVAYRRWVFHHDERPA
ncbi:GtrA family protein [Nocardioides sp. SYSU D00038]|uniref:GtrA family protein n=1 Tax=Nocardioides sp. SYSU D00038 TaxID=2812554 RepID=UPI001967F591|nr:GtrA family protein [Nocardioides sp. SYSU D00038]